MEANPGKYYAYDHNLPCKNPNCKSHGRPHPNCQCYAEGGSVCASGSAHSPGCEYFADGGMAEPQAPMPAPAHPSVTLSHAAIPNGLLGILKSVGQAKMIEPDRHHKLLHDARSRHQERKNPTGIETKMESGHKLADHILDQNHDGAADMMHGHALVGSAPKGSVKAILARLGPAMLERDPDAQAVRASSDYLGDAIRGHDELSSHINGIVGGQKSPTIKVESSTRDSLKKTLDEIEENPSKLLDVGGKIGHYLPDHAAEIGALSARATQYLSSIKPKDVYTGPFEDPQEPDASSRKEYERQLDVAQKPMIALTFAKDGTLTNQDVTTLKTIYPKLYESIGNKLGEALIEAKSKGKRIPYEQRLGFSLLVGTPLDSTLTPQSMQAIIKSHGVQQQQQAAKANQKKDATAIALKELDKANSLSETPLETRQIDKKS